MSKNKNKLPPELKGAVSVQPATEAEEKAAPDLSDLDDLEVGSSVDDLALQREQLAVERVKLRQDEKEAIRLAEENLRKLTNLQADLEKRGNVINRFRSEDGPLVKEIHFTKSFSLPASGIRDVTRLVLENVPETKRPRIIDLPKERKLVFIAPKPGADVHVVLYEGISRLVYGPMTE